MSVLIRKEIESDYRVVEEIARNTFWNLYFPGCHEHFVINKMRTDEDFIRDLSFVVELDDKIVGAIFFTKSRIITPDNKTIETITFGPVFIAREYHRKGFGRKLITHSINMAREKGYRAIITLGYSYHYEPYGFMSGKKYNISMSDMKYYKGLLVLPLYRGALDDISGYVQFSSVLESDQKSVDAFDKNFEYKEKKYQDSQKEYEIASSQLD